MSFRKLLATIGFATVGVLLPVASIAVPVQAISQDRAMVLRCPTSEVIDDQTVVSFNQSNCDLGVDKLVSVNGGAFVEADTEPDAAQAHIGDTITYKIIVTNNSAEGLNPSGTVYVQDVLPVGVTYQTYTTTNGQYRPNDGSLFENSWNFSTRDSDGNSLLPAELTITTTANAAGVYQNTASLWKYDTGVNEGGLPYSDAHPSNDQNDAWIDPQAQPQVLGESTTSTPQVLGATTLADTGSSTFLASIVSVLLITGTLAIGYTSRRSGDFLVKK